MSKKVYTRVYGGYISVMGIIPDPFPPSLQWLMQDDIEVVGAECVMACSAPSQNDGYSWAKVEISQTSVKSQSGQILEAMATEGWNTTPAGITLANGHAVLALPEGYAIPVKEEGYLYVNFDAVGKSAGVCEYQYKVIIFYIKSSRR